MQYPAKSPEFAEALQQVWASQGGGVRLGTTPNFLLARRPLLRAPVADFALSAACIKCILDPSNDLATYGYTYVRRLYPGGSATRGRAFVQIFEPHRKTRTSKAWRLHNVCLGAATGGHWLRRLGLPSI